MSDGYRAVLPTCKKVIWLVLPPVLINLCDRKTFLLDVFASPWESPGCSDKTAFAAVQFSRWNISKKMVKISGDKKKI